MRGTRRARNWKRLIVGERIETKHGELTSWKLLAGPWSAHKGAMSRVQVECVECGRVYERRLSKIIQRQSHRCRSCALRERRRKSCA
jgi:hypothetical protein